LSDSLIATRNAYEALVARASGGSRSPAVSLLGGRVALKDVQASLANGEALLEYLVTPSRLLIFVVTRSGITACEGRNDAASLSARVRLARDLIQQSRGDSVANGVLRALHGVVVAPAEACGSLRGISRLVVVPHGVLTYLPFAALIDGASGRFVVEKYALLYASTAAAFVAMRSVTVRADRQVQPAGGAVFSPFPNELPGTREESNGFLRAIKRSSAWVGSAATEQRLRAAVESGALVHLATHAFMNAGNPLFSRVELAGNRGGPPADDGRLEVHELLSLRSSSPLIFLSGCETALGAAGSTSFDSGEDFTTIGQALLFAGARNVVATLWRINDIAAAELARRFYESLRTLSPAESLAMAQRGMIADPRFRSPYLWAAYQTSGAGAYTPLFAKIVVLSDKP
jgi:CHAT domain-containing protein